MKNLKTPWIYAVWMLAAILALGLAQPTMALDGIQTGADSSALTVGSFEAAVDGQPYTLDAAPYIKPGVNRVLAPVKFISEALGLKVEWNEAAGQVLLQGRNKEIVMTIGAKGALVNGEGQNLDCPPELRPPGRVFVPLRFVTQALDAGVDYDDTTGQVTITGASGLQTRGAGLYQRAVNLESQKSFAKAADLYEQALPMLQGKDKDLASSCAEAIQRMDIFEEIYPNTLGQLYDYLQQAYPQATPEQINGWIDSKELERYFWDGEDHYFEQSADNLRFRHLELIHSNQIADQTYHDLVLELNQAAGEKPGSAKMQYQNPVTYKGVHTISIPRDELPKSGTYRIWLPLPINYGPQTQVAIESVIPTKWVKQPPSIDGDISLLYMEVPMEELSEDLFIQVKFAFTHYEQRSCVDPGNVGEYDQCSELFKKYTRSYGNTEITADIHEMAQEIVGSETNPYLAAHKVYNYIVNNIDYSFMPHLVMWPRTPQSETDYVHKYRRGDCGAQSMYFSALCRSLGIPARTTGGWQLFDNEFQGHFWAEFYLPNYGWLPVDTSAAQLALYPQNLDTEQRQMFIDYYFGNQDHMRCVVQKDTDEPLIPQSNSMVFLPAAIQIPTVEYSIPTAEVPARVFLEHWAMQCQKCD